METVARPATSRPRVPGSPVALPARAPRAQPVANATLVDREDLGRSVARLWVRPDEGRPAFEPGQYFALGLVMDGSLLQRPYSTASDAARPGDLEFLVRLVEHGAFTPHLWRVPVGGRLWLGRPKGLFTLRPNDPRRHLFVSTGTGLAPLISMVEALIGRATLEAAPLEPPIVVHGVARVEELAYRRRLAELDEDGSIVYRPAISRPDDPSNAGWPGLTGRLDRILPEILDGEGVEPGGVVAYVCGNPGMIEAVSAFLAERAVPGEDIVSERYWDVEHTRAAS